MSYPTTEHTDPRGHSPLTHTGRDIPRLRPRPCVTREVGTTDSGPPPRTVPSHPVCGRRTSLRPQSTLVFPRSLPPPVLRPPSSVDRHDRRRGPGPLADTSSPRGSVKKKRPRFDLKLPVPPYDSFLAPEKDPDHLGERSEGDGQKRGGVPQLPTGFRLDRTPVTHPLCAENKAH